MPEWLAPECGALVKRTASNKIEAKLFDLQLFRQKASATVKIKKNLSLSIDRAPSHGHSVFIAFSEWNNSFCSEAPRALAEF